jgi:hypothetical protein
MYATVHVFELRSKEQYNNSIYLITTEIMARLSTAIALCLAASASAFAPAPQAAKNSALNVEINKQVGVQAPVGYFE